MWPFWFGLLFIRDPSSIKAALLLYYTSVLISTKIMTFFSLWDPDWTWPRGLTKLKDQDYLQAQHISWSLVLPPGQNHGTFASPSGAPPTFLFFLMISLSYNHPKDITTSLITDTTWQNFIITTTSCMIVILSFLLNYSFIFCYLWRLFPLIYMYKSSTYYAVTCINLGPIFPQSTSL